MNADNKLKSITGYSKLWDGDPVNRIRAGDGATSYPGRRLAMHLMAQPVAIRPLLADREASGQGFLARFLMTEPPSAIGTRLRRGHDPASQDILHRFAARLRVILDTPLPLSENNQGLSPRVLCLSEDASDLLWSYYYRVEAAQAQGQAFEHTRAYAFKSPEQAARIAGVLTLWENIDAVSVSAETMSSAITLAEFYLHEAKRLAEAGLISEETERAETLRKWLEDEWSQREILPSDILQFGPNALRELKVVKRLVTVLVEAGHLIKLEPNTQVRGKMRREAYRLVNHSTR